MIRLLALTLLLVACSYAPAASQGVAIVDRPERHVVVVGQPIPDSAAGMEGGVASWFNSYGPGLYAAVPSYRWGDPRYNITVCRADTPSRCVVVVVRDFCGCPGERIVDLSRDAFSRLEDPSRGLVRVTVTTGGGPAPTPPQTDSEGTR